MVGPFVLTNVLLPKLESTARDYGNARVVVVSSSLHMACQELKFERLLEQKAEKCPEALDACWRYGRRYVFLCWREKFLEVLICDM